MMNGTCHFDDMGMSMKMYFHFSACERLLFSSWKITNAGELIGAIIAVYILAILYEGLKTLKEWLLYREIKMSGAPNRTISIGVSDKSPLVDNVQNYKQKRIKSVSFGMHSLQSVLHVVQVGYGYILMLIAMTFNGWLFLAVCFGAGTGYFLFAKTRHLFGVTERDEHEHCS